MKSPVAAGTSTPGSWHSELEARVGRVRVWAPWGELSVSVTAIDYWIAGFGCVRPKAARSLQDRAKYILRSAWAPQTARASAMEGEPPAAAYALRLAWTPAGPRQIGLFVHYSATVIFGPVEYQVRDSTSRY